MLHSPILEYLHLLMAERFMKQIDAYLSWRQRHVYNTVFEREILHEFARFSKVGDVTRITIHDLRAYYRHIEERSPYIKMASMRSIRGLLRYFKARGFECLSPDVIKTLDARAGQVGFTSVEEGAIISGMKQYTRTRKVGRRPNIPLVRKVKFLRDHRGLSFGQIAKLIHKDKHHVYDMYNYPLDKYLSEGLL